MINIEECYEQRDKTFILSDKVCLEIKLDKSDAWNIDSYITYRVDNHWKENKIKAYTKYVIKEKILDEHNNLILICDEEYNTVEI